MKHMLFTPQKSRPIETGDAGIVFTKEGGFFLFKTGEIQPKALTDEEIDQGIALEAFKMALSVPAVMNILVKMANDPGVIRGMDLMERHERASAN